MLLLKLTLRRLLSDSLILLNKLSTTVNSLLCGNDHCGDLLVIVCFVYRSHEFKMSTGRRYRQRKTGPGAAMPARK
jgi:hypothetical protein